MRGSLTLPLGKKTKASLEYPSVLSAMYKATNNQRRTLRRKRELPLNSFPPADTLTARLFSSRQQQSEEANVSSSHLQSLEMVL
jgi:hypothetical protein